MTGSQQNLNAMKTHNRTDTTSPRTHFNQYSCGFLKMAIFDNETVNFRNLVDGLFAVSYKERQLDIRLVIRRDV